MGSSGDLSQSGGFAGQGLERFATCDDDVNRLGNSAYDFPVQLLLLPWSLDICCTVRFVLSAIVVLSRPPCPGVGGRVRLFHLLLFPASAMITPLLTISFSISLLHVFLAPSPGFVLPPSLAVSIFRTHLFAGYRTTCPI